MEILVKQTISSQVTLRVIMFCCGNRNPNEDTNSVTPQLIIFIKQTSPYCFISRSHSQSLNPRWLKFLVSASLLNHFQKEIMFHMNNLYVLQQACSFMMPKAIGQGEHGRKQNEFSVN